MRSHILIIGRDGQLARALAKRKRAGGTTISCIGRPDLDLGTADLLAARELISKQRPDIVINTAAYTAVDLAETEPEIAFATNANGPRVLAEATAQAGIPIIQVSTDYVFDGQKPSPYLENDATNPLCIYGASKRAGELAVETANHKHVIIRTSWLYSETGKNFAKSILQMARVRDELTIVSDQIGRPTSADELADGLFRVVDNILFEPTKSELYGYFHAANSGQTSWHGFADEILHISEGLGGPQPRLKAVTTADYPGIAKRPLNSVLDCSKIRRVHGVELSHWQHPIAEMVKTTLALEY